MARDALGLRPAAHYRELGVELITGRSAVELDLARRVARLDEGDPVAWNLLCIATGSDARRLPGHDGAIHLRELPAADRLKRLIESGLALDVAGAGFIGCEVAAAAAQRGCAVRVYETLEQPMLRVLGPAAGAYVAGLHRGHGVELHLGATAPPSTALVAVGSAPRTQLAEQAGIVVDRGIVVDELGRTSAPGVFAAGDATRFRLPLFETHVRVEHFQTAQRQGFAVGRAMAGGTAPYDEVPWFWSDQYDVNLQYAGAGLPWEDVVLRGELGRPPFSVFYVAGGRVVGVLGVNDHHTVARARHAMQRRASLSRSQLEDPGFDLRRAPA